MPATGRPNVAQNLFLGGYGSPVQGIPGSKVMSSWLPINLVGTSVAATGVIASPGPTISYTSTGGNTLILCGYVNASVNGGLTSAAGITSITDTAGNAWQWSPGNSQFPPSAFNPDNNGFVAFVAWCVNAAAVTSVTVNDSTGFSDTWNVSLSEWSGITFPDYGVAGISLGASGGTGSPAVTVPCSTPNDLIVAALRAETIVSTSPPFPFVQLTGTALNNGHYVVGSQILSTIAAPGFVQLGGSNASSSGPFSGAVALNPPQDLVLGDLIIIDVSVGGAGTVTGWPPGFVQQLQITGVNSAANQRWVATKLADGTEGATLSVTVAGGATNFIGLTYGLRGVASATPSNVATFTQSGYQTTGPSASLTIGAATDATVYGYAGYSSGYAGSPIVNAFALGTLLNTNGTGLTGGWSSMAWGTDVAAPGTLTGISPAVDLLNYGMDFPLRPLGIGGQVTYTWTLGGSAGNAIVAMSFGPAGVPVATQPSMQAF